MSDTLYVLRPGFRDKEPLDDDATYFCPYSAQVIGFVTYYPQVGATLEIVELGFEKPREPLASVLGEDLQAAPMLVLGEGSPTEVDGVTFAEAKGKTFVEKTKDILRYLAVTRGVPRPH